MMTKKKTPNKETIRRQAILDLLDELAESTMTVKFNEDDGYDIYISDGTDTVTTYDTAKFEEFFDKVRSVQSTKKASALRSKDGDDPYADSVVAAGDLVLVYRMRNNNDE
jgi:flagellar hook-associated protein FlgK